LERGALASGIDNKGDEGGKYEEPVREVQSVNLVCEGKIGRGCLPVSQVLNCEIMREEDAVPLQVEADADSKAIHVRISRETVGGHDGGSKRFLVEERYIS
jgi:hypothetical protein